MSSAISVEHNGVKVEYKERYRRWEAYVNERTITAEQLEDLKKKIDNAKKAKSKIERLPVLYRSGRGGAFVPAQITSFDGHRPRISYSHAGSKVRDTVYDSTVYDATPENVEILEQIEPLAKQEAELRTKILMLERKLTQTGIRAYREKVRALLEGNVE